MGRPPRERRSVPRQGPQHSSTIHPPLPLALHPLTTPPTGKPVSHKFAKELLAGFVGGEVDKLAETKGMDEYDSIEARRHAKQSAENMYDQHYGQQGDEYRPDMDRPQYNRY